ncbi:MAG TPA: hypothetical protein VF595_00580 [Tepidisphaeraceae bacterium]
MTGLKLGEILVQQGILTNEQVDHVLHIQRAIGRPFGDLVERLYGIEPSVIQDAWVEQYADMVGRIDLPTIEVDAECRNLVTRRQAWQFHLVPLFRDSGYLHVATTQESLVRAVNFANRTLSEPVYFRLADRKQVNAFLMQHYPVPNFLAQFAEAF